VVKKKVKFAEGYVSSDDEPSKNELEFVKPVSSQSGVNQFQDLLEQEVAKEN
jgi:hypothetical protein